jgi:hypothetical protein
VRFVGCPERFGELEPVHLLASRTGLVRRTAGEHCIHARHSLLESPPVLEVADDDFGSQLAQPVRRGGVGPPRDCSYSVTVPEEMRYDWSEPAGSSQHRDVE